MIDLPETAPRDISCVYIGRVGDVIVATPFLRALRARFPNARIRLIVGYRSRQVLPLLPFIDDSLVLERPFSLIANLKFIAGLLIRRCDLFIDLNSSYSNTSTMIARAVRAPIRYSFEKGRAPAAFNRTIAAPAVEEHMSDRYRRLAEGLGAPYDPNLEVRIPERDAGDAKKLIPRGASGKFRVAIHPGNFDRFSFRWQEEKFAELSNRLAADAGIEIFYLGGPGEEAPIAKIAAAVHPSPTIIPPARLGVAAAILREMDLFICNITGTTHLAAAVGTPTFGFYAGYTNTVWRPRGSIHGGTCCAEWQTCRLTTVDEAYEALSRHIRELRELPLRSA